MSIVESGSVSSQQMYESRSPVDSGAHNSNTVCLLANDNQFLLMAFKINLAKHFKRVETAENGQEAVDAVRSHERNYYTAIVLDISMPIMDGMQAFTLI